MKNVRTAPMTVWITLIIAAIILLEFILGFSQNLQIPSTYLGSIKNSLISSGIVLSLVFLFMRPRVKIADEISIRKDKNKPYYTFKIINSSFFSAYDMKLEANICKRQTANKTGKHKHVWREKLNLTAPMWVHIPEWKWVHPGTEEAPHCITIRCLREDLMKTISENEDYIELQVTLKHGFSNLTRTYIKNYHGEFCFKKGKFDFGNTFNIQ